MRKFLVGILGLCLVIVLPCSSASAGQGSVQDELSFAQKYELNLLELSVGGSWEYPSANDEFKPDTELGMYSKKEKPQVLLDKYANYLTVNDSLGLLDSMYTVADAEALELSRRELLDISDVSFYYYYDYRTLTLMQLCEINWVSGVNSTLYAIWNNNSVTWLEVNN